jgi:hypothetical protein
LAVTHSKRSLERNSRQICQCIPTKTCARGRPLPCLVPAVGTQEWPSVTGHARGQVGSRTTLGSKAVRRAVLSPPSRCAPQSSPRPEGSPCPEQHTTMRGLRQAWRASRGTDPKRTYPGVKPSQRTDSRQPRPPPPTPSPGRRAPSPARCLTDAGARRAGGVRRHGRESPRPLNTTAPSN